MNCLLIICHPFGESLNAALAETARVTLRERGHEVCVRNLYAQEFEPALAAEELRGFQKGPVPGPLTAEMHELRVAEVLVLVFPTWWFGFPAMLKGWFDRVWAPGVAYEATALGKLLPRLLTLKQTVVVTTLGSPWWVDRLVLRQPVRRILKHAVLATCAPRSKLEFLSFYGCDKLGPQQVEAMKDRVAAALRRI